MASDAINDIIQHSIGLDSTIGRRFVRDFAKAAATGAYKEFRERYKLSRADWQQVPQNSKLIKTVKAERDRRANGGGSAVDGGGSSVSNVVELHPVRLEENLGFVSDCCRFQEGLLTEARMKMKYGFADKIWEDLGNNSALLEAVEDEKIRRMRSKAGLREKAQLHVLRAPDIAAKIMLDDNANNRHRLDACKVLDDFSANPGNTAPAADRFVISIVLSADGIPHTEHYNKSIKPDVHDVDPFNDDTGVIAAIAMKKEDDGGGDNTL